jgi:hypothetical protein
MSKRTLHEQVDTRPVHPKDSVVFYRNFATFSPIGRCWHLEVNGSILTPSKRHLRKHAFLHLLKRVVKPEKQSDVHQRFRDRARLFTNVSRKGQSVPIAIGEQAYLLPDSTVNGQFQTVLTIQESELEPSIQVDPFGRRFVQFCAHLPEEDARLFSGEIELIPPEGISVISDVDDTIKITNVTDRRELLANTFTREFRSVPGMRELFQSLAAAGMSFHYVSASPWPLYEPLCEWLDEDEFPLGSIHLRHARLAEFRKDKKRERPFQAKRAAIERILRAFPHRRFLLFGDAGERDVELYAGIADSFGDQVAHVAIRQTADDRNRDASNGSLSLLSALPRQRWTFFEDPRELADRIASLTRIGSLPSGTEVSG